MFGLPGSPVFRPIDQELSQRVQLLDGEVVEAAASAALRQPVTGAGWGAAANASRGDGTSCAASRYTARYTRPAAPDCPDRPASY